MADERSKRLPDALVSLGDGAWQTALGEAVERSPSPELAVAGLGRLLDAGGGEALAAWPAAELEDLAVVLGASGALTRYLAAFGPAWPAAAVGYREANPDRRTLVERAGLVDGGGDDCAAARLRALAKREMYRIGARDLLALAPLSETLAAITLLAEVAIDLSVRHLRARLAAEAGEVVGQDGAPVGFVVLGLGKLGGRELNYSSDVDLMYVYASDAVADGSPAAAPFFARLAQEVTRMVGENTADGRVFRVDLRLRPEGLNGPLVNSVSGALTYYEGWGDTWERGALAKARPVGGDPEVGRDFLEQVRPFIYRRHLDYATVERLRDMKDRIDAEQRVRARGARDVKLGSGCIRELEFVVQMLQLIHGGHEPAVRAEGTRAALESLREHGFVAADQAAVLHEAYVFLRTVEHAIQIVEQRQTQRLPQDPDGMRALARRLGYGLGRRGAPAEGDPVERFEIDWERHTRAVRDAFVRFLELRPDEPARERTAADAEALAALAMLARGEEREAAEVLAAMGFPDGEKASASLGRLYHGRIAGPASPQRRRAVESMAPALLAAVLASADPESALDRLVDFLVRTGAHTSYLALLGGSPATMEILVSLFATSSYLAGRLVGHPELLDTLVRSDADPSGRSVSGLRAALEEDLSGITEEEEVLAALRRFRTLEVIRAGMDDLSGLLATDEVHEFLSDLAEACLQSAADQAIRYVGGRAQPPPGTVELAIVALGKMGAREMTYGSDLDLLFVYEVSDAEFDVDVHAFVTRWVQKIVSFLQTRTRDGIAYKIDTRLRPSGHQGPLVTSLRRFVEYHEREAQLWERQAHVRARPVYGGEALRERIEGIIEGFVYGRPLADEEVAEIDALRRRVEEELAAEGPGKMNIKTGRGGIVDIEFIAQMLQLRHGHEIEDLRRRATLDALAALRSVGVLPDRDAGLLIEHYRFLRRLEARLRLERDRPVEEIGTDQAVLAPLARRMGFDGSDPGGALLARYEKTREEVRALYGRYMSASAVDV